MKIAILSVIYGNGASKFLNNFIYSNAKKESKNFFLKLVVDHGFHEVPKRVWIENDILYYQQQNKGFGAGVNSGLKVLFDDYECDYVIVMNPDITFSYDELINKCKNLNKDFYVFQLDENGIKKSIIYYSYFSGKINQNKSFFSVPFFNGAAFIISKKIFKSNIKFDERYFMYFEDIDLSITLHRMNICINIINTKYMFHEVAGCSNINNRVIIEREAAISGLIFTKKNYPLNIILYVRYIIKYIFAGFRY